MNNNKENKIKKCAIYCRIATRSVTDKSESMEEQKNECLTHAKKDSCEIVSIFEEFASGSSLFHRPGFKKLLALVEEKKIDSIYVANTERLSRNVMDYVKIRDLCRKNNVELKICNISPKMREFEMMAYSHILEIQRRVHSEQVKMALRHRKELLKSK